MQETELIQETAKQLLEYLEGKRTEFSIPLNPKGTEFQKKVWEALQAIPYGQTRSYKQIACNIGNEKACRAIGMANHNNPIMCIIPCHRVIGADGRLVGYAGGLHVKEQLLNLEKHKA
jgi:methylated-DNA-[protein]-cysteine S-methyltransferase